MPRALISAGHTLMDPGDIYGDLREADITRKIATMVVPHLKNSGVIAMQVPFDLPILQRIEWINNTGYRESLNDICVEIHINSGGKRGIEGWYKGEGGNPSQKLAKTLVDNVTATTGYRNNGVKSEYDHELGSLSFINRTNTVTTIIECLYIDNEEDIRILRNDDKLEELAAAIAGAITKYFGNLPTPPQPVKKPEPQQKPVAHREELEFERRSNEPVAHSQKHQFEQNESVAELEHQPQFKSQFNKSINLPNYEQDIEEADYQPEPKPKSEIKVTLQNQQRAPRPQNQNNHQSNRDHGDRDNSSNVSPKQDRRNEDKDNQNYQQPQQPVPFNNRPTPVPSVPPMGQAAPRPQSNTQFQFGSSAPGFGNQNSAPMSGFNFGNNQNFGGGMNTNPNPSPMNQFGAGFNPQTSTPGFGGGFNAMGNNNTAGFGATGGGMGAFNPQDREARKEMIIKRYSQILGREPSQTDLNYFLNTGVTDEQLTKRIVDSQEHVDLVKAKQELQKLKQDTDSIQSELMQLRSRAGEQDQMLQSMQSLLAVKNQEIMQLNMLLQQAKVFPTYQNNQVPQANPLTIPTPPQKNLLERFFDLFK